MKEEPAEKKRIFTGNLLNLNADRVLLGNGEKTFREYVSHPGAVAALPFLTSDKILLVKQYRYAVRKYLLEIPAGTIEKGETPEETMIRELKEEIKYKPGNLEKFGWLYLTPGYSDEKIHLFKATELQPCSLEAEMEEEIEIVKIRIEEAFSKINTGEIKDGKTIIAILSFLNNSL